MTFCLLFPDLFVVLLHLQGHPLNLLILLGHHVRPIILDRLDLFETLLLNRLDRALELLNLSHLLHDLPVLVPQLLEQLAVLAHESLDLLLVLFLQLFILALPILVQVHHLVSMFLLPEVCPPLK